MAHLLIARVHVGAALDEHLEHLEVAVIGGQVERAPLPVVEHGDRGAVREQQTTHLNRATMNIRVIHREYRCCSRRAHET